jgi:hypothetical protein
MPNKADFTRVSRELKKRLNGKAFLTIPRMDITQLVRDVSGEEGTRIKTTMAEDLEWALLNQGVRCFPSLAETTTGDTVRLFHSGTLLGQLVDLVSEPHPDEDHDLADVLTKIKGKWRAMPMTPADHATHT